MPRALQIVPPLPKLRTALERFLARSRFAARTRESYAQDLASLVAQHGEEPIISLTHQTGVAFLAFLFGAALVLAGHRLPVGFTHASCWLVVVAVALAGVIVASTSIGGSTVVVAAFNWVVDRL